MARKKYDPLQFIPSPEIVREQLEETLAMADRLRVLLEVAERIRSAPTAHPQAGESTRRVSAVLLLGEGGAR